MNNDTNVTSQYNDVPWPSAAIEDEDTFAENASVDAHSDADDTLALLLRDGLDYPICNLPVRIELPQGAPVETTTTDMGAILFAVPPEMKGFASLSVLGLDGQMQQVCSIDLARCETGAIIRSPKVLAPLQLKPRNTALAQAAANTASMPVETKPAGSEVKPEPATCKAETSKVEAAPWYTDALEKSWAWLTSRVHDSDKKPPACGASTARSEQPHVTGQHVVKESASKVGNPITVVVGPECPNAENFWLGLNNVYRAHIHKAAKHCGMSPQSIAALIDAEAGKIPERIPLKHADGSPVLDKQKRPVSKAIGYRWNKDSHNINPKTGDGAAGLTQFMPSTWMGQGLQPGYYVHDQFKSKGWVMQSQDKNGKSAWAFKLSNGKTTTSPLSHRGDANVDACLKARFDPEWSIMAAADYAKVNLQALQKKGFKLAGLSDADKAKLMYLMHHEGEPNGPWFIKNELDKHISEEKMKAIFLQQLGPSNIKRLEKMIKDAGGDVYKAYREWLAGYINHNIDPSKFACDKSRAEIPTPCFVLMKNIGGSGE